MFTTLTLPIFAFPPSREDVHFSLLNKYYGGQPATITKVSSMKGFLVNPPPLCNVKKEEDTSPITSCWTRRRETSVVIELCAKQQPTIRALPLLDNVKDAFLYRATTPQPEKHRKAAVDLHAAMCHLVDDQLEHDGKGNGNGNIRLLTHWCNWTHWGGHPCSDEALMIALGYLCQTRGHVMTRLLVDLHRTQHTTMTTTAWITLKERCSLKLTCQGGMDVCLPTLDVANGFIGDAAGPSWNWAFREWKKRFDATDGRSWNDPIFPANGILTFNDDGKQP